MIPSEQYIRDAMKQIRKNRIVFAFYAEQIKQIQEQSKLEQIEITVNKGQWVHAIYKKMEVKK